MRGPRLLGLAVVGLVLAAIVLWASSRGTWLTAIWDVPLRGRVTATAKTHTPTTAYTPGKKIRHRKIADPFRAELV